MNSGKKKCNKEEIDTMPVRQLLADIAVFNQCLVGSDDLIEDVKPLRVNFNSFKVFFGNELTAQAGSVPPTLIEVPQPKSDALYTILVVDADAPARGGAPFIPPNTTPGVGVRDNILHYGIVNIPVQGSKEKSKSCNYVRLQIERGFTFAAWRGVQPPPNSGYHRYALLVYEQPHRIDTSRPALTFIPPNNAVARAHFWPDTFLSAALGGGNSAKLVAMNYFVVRNLVLAPLLT